jgi:hypothetical protein
LAVSNQHSISGFHLASGTFLIVRGLNAKC